MAPEVHTAPRHISSSSCPEQPKHSCQWRRALLPLHRSSKRTQWCPRSLIPRSRQYPPLPSCRHRGRPASRHTPANVLPPPSRRPRGARRATRLSRMTPTNLSSRRLCGSSSRMQGVSLTALRPLELADPDAFSAALTLFLATTDAVRSVLSIQILHPG